MKFILLNSRNEPNLIEQYPVLKEYNVTPKEDFKGTYIIDIKDLDELTQFIKDTGNRVVIEKSFGFDNIKESDYELEIYDDWRE